MPKRKIQLGQAENLNEIDDQAKQVKISTSPSKIIVYNETVSVNETKSKLSNDEMLLDSLRENLKKLINDSSFRELPKNPINKVIFSACDMLNINNKSSFVNQEIVNFISLRNLKEESIIHLVSIVTRIPHIIEHNVAEFLLRRLLNCTKHSDSNNNDVIHFSIGTNAQFNWNIKNLEQLASSIFMLLSIYRSLNTYRCIIYEQIIRIIFRIRASSTLKTKSEVRSNEKKVLAIICQDMSLDNENGEKSADMLKTIERIATANSADLVTSNQFVWSLLVKLAAGIHMSLQERLNSFALMLIRSIFEVQIKTDQCKWIESCVTNKSSLNELYCYSKFRYLIQMMDARSAWQGLLELASTILKYYGAEINDNCLAPSNFKEHASRFVAIILEDLFKANKDARFATIEFLLSQIVLSFNEMKYICQLEILMNSTYTLRFFVEDTNRQERDQVIKLLCEKIPDYMDQASYYPDIAERFFSSLRCLFFVANKNQRTDFIQLGKNVKATSSVDSKKLSVIYLTTLLKALNGDHVKSPRDISLVLKSKLAEENSVTMQTIFNHLKQVLHKLDKEAAIKSQIYQTFYSVCSNMKFVEGVLLTLKKQLEGLVYKRGDETHIDLAKCLISREQSIFKLTEPVDILIHCTVLCLNYIKTNQPDLALNKLSRDTLNDLTSLLVKLSKTFIDVNAEQLFDVFKNQTAKLARSTSSPIKMAHQLELGVIDALIEFTLDNDPSGNVNKLLSKRESMEQLISADLEDLISRPKPLQDNNSQLPTKRKRPIEKTSIVTRSKLSLKRLKSSFTEVDKENNPPVRPVTSKAATLKNISLSNVQFEHMPRISFESCLLMTQICFKYDKTDKLTVNDTNYSNMYLNIIANDKFEEYTLNIVESKLRMLLKYSFLDLNINNGQLDYEPISSLSFRKSMEYYDPEANEPVKIFEFLAKLWRILTARITGYTQLNGKCTFHPNLSQRFNVKFLNNTQRLITFCQGIWCIVNRQFQKRVNDLFDSNGDSANIWKFFVNCSSAIKNYLNPSQVNQESAIKCCCSTLNLMYDILKSKHLPLDKYNNCFSWLCELASNEFASQGEMYKSIMNLMLHVMEKTSSPSKLLKYFILDYHDQALQSQPFTMDMNLAEMTDENIQFKMFRRKNLNEMQNFLLEKSANILADFEWVISSNIDFNQSKLVCLICCQLESIIVALEHTMLLTSKTKSAEKCLNLMIRFYEFICKFLESKVLSNPSVENLEQIRDIFTLISSVLQSNLVANIDRIKEITSTSQTTNKVQEETEIIKLVSYKNLIEQLIGSIELFECSIKEYQQMNKHFEINLLENYTNWIKDMTFNVTSSMARVISETTINRIISTRY